MAQVNEKLYSIARKRVFVAGHRGMVGSALCRRLSGEVMLQTVGYHLLDLRRQAEVEEWFAANRPEAAFVAAAKVGGISANSKLPADFLYDNLAIQTNVIEAARKSGVQKLLFLGSACMYPKMAQQPIAEDELLSGPLEPTNEWYAIAKIAGVKLCHAYRRQYGVDFISVIPASLYGQGDTFDPQSSHVLAALILKIHKAKVTRAPNVTLWVTGSALREFMHIDDFVDAAIFLMEHYSAEAPINAGTGEELSILALAQVISGIIGWEGRFVLDTTKPDGMPRKLLDTTRLNEMGWKPRMTLADGIRATYDWFLDQGPFSRAAS